MPRQTSRTGQNKCWQHSSCTPQKSHAETSTQMKNGAWLLDNQAPNLKPPCVTGPQAIKHIGGCSRKVTTWKVTPCSYRRQRKKTATQESCKTTQTHAEIPAAPDVETRLPRERELKRPNQSYHHVAAVGINLINKPANKPAITYTSKPVLHYWVATANQQPKHKNFCTKQHSGSEPSANHHQKTKSAPQCLPYWD